MKKISDLTGDEFFDVIYSLSPILPMITNMEIIQMQLFGKFNKNILDARETVAIEEAKRIEAMGMQDGDGTTAIKNKTIESCAKKINEANAVIESEISGIFGKDISNIVPFLTSKDNRNCIFETLAILENLTVEEIKKYPAPKLWSKIWKVIKDADFKSFLSYAEELGQTE